MVNVVSVSGIERGRAMVPTSIERVNRQDSRPTEDSLAVEEPPEIQLDYGQRAARRVKSISVTMRTPGVNDIDQIVYASESKARISEEKNERTSILPSHPSTNIVRVDLGPEIKVSLATVERNFYTASSCGVCGKESLLALRAVCPARLRNTFSSEADLLYDFPSRLRKAQSVFDRTGGLHGAGLFNVEGSLMGLREDVGRHDAVDKLLGSKFLADRTRCAIPCFCFQDTRALGYCIRR